MADPNRRMYAAPALHKLRPIVLHVADLCPDLPRLDRAYSFGELRQTYGPLFVRCDVPALCSPVSAKIRDTDYRTKPNSQHRR